MRQLKSSLMIGYLLLILGFATLIFPMPAQSFSQTELDANRLPWTRLSFHAQNFWVEVSTDVQLRSLPASDLEAVLLPSPRGTPIKPETPQTAKMTISTIINPALRSAVRIHNQVWFNPDNAAALGRVRLRLKDDDFKKIYRFTDQGVFRHRMEPKNKKEASLAPEKWTDVKDSFYPYDLTRLKCSDVSERSLIIYILSAAAFPEHNDSLSLCVFGKRQLHRVTLRKAGVHPLNVNYIEKKKQNETHKEGIVKALKITLTSEPMKSDLTEDENFSFLGFHKDISIYLDPATRLPIQASGIIPTAGKATLNLNRVWLKN